VLSTKRGSSCNSHSSTLGKNDFFFAFLIDRRVRDHRGRAIGGYLDLARGRVDVDYAKTRGAPSLFTAPPNKRRRSLARDQEGDRSSGPPAREHATSKSCFARRCARCTCSSTSSDSHAKSVTYRRFSGLGAERMSITAPHHLHQRSCGPLRLSRLQREGRSHDIFQLLKERAGLAAAGILGCAIWAAIPSTANAAFPSPRHRIRGPCLPQHQRLFAARFDRALESQRCGAESCLSPWATGARRDRKDAGREKVTHHPRPAAGSAPVRACPARLFSYATS